YQLLFDMKHDLNDLKGLVFEMIRNNDLEVPDMTVLRTKNANIRPAIRSNSRPLDFTENDNEHQNREESDYGTNFQSADQNRPYILNAKDNHFNRTEIIDEDLSLENMEKEMIKKALKKHANKRKEAAEELGISERTLYRKISQYSLDN
ncbi:MAG: helix-turn-helix domain-containing protein, partial [Saprospiraceae bacterium]